MVFSKNIYSYPISPSIRIKNILREWPSHEGPYKGAIDFAVDLGTPVLAPLDGKIVAVLDAYDTYGGSEKYAQYTNHITIAHDKGEFSQLAHIAKNSSQVKVGDRVTKANLPLPA